MAALAAPSANPEMHCCQSLILCITRYCLNVVCHRFTIWINLIYKNIYFKHVSYSFLFRAIKVRKHGSKNAACNRSWIHGSPSPDHRSKATESVVCRLRGCTVLCTVHHCKMFYVMRAETERLQLRTRVGLHRPTDRTRTSCQNRFARFPSLRHLVQFSLENERERETSVRPVQFGPVGSMQSGLLTSLNVNNSPSGRADRPADWASKPTRCTRRRKYFIVEYYLRR